MIKYLFITITFFIAERVTPQCTLTIHQVGKISDTLFVANYEDTTITRINDSTLLFKCNYYEPDYLYVLLDRNQQPKWFTRLWIDPQKKEKEITVDYSRKTVIIKNPDEWDIVTAQWKGGQLLEDLNEQKEADSIALTYVESHLDSFLSLWFLTHGLFRHDKEKRLALLNKLNPALHSYSDYRQAMAGLKLREYPAVGDYFKEFTLSDKNDSLFNSNSIKNKWILLHFWSNGCGPCVREMDAFVDLYKSLDTSRIEFVSVALDVNKNMWKHATASNKIIWPSVWEEDEGYGALCMHYNVYSMPFFILFNNEKKIVFINDGADQLENIKTLLKEKGLFR